MYESCDKIGLLLIFLHLWSRIQLSYLASSFISCLSTFWASEMLWLCVSLSFCVLVCMLPKNPLYNCFRNFQEELKSHTGIQSTWVFNWPSFHRRSPKVFQSLFPPLLEPYCLWTMLKIVIKENIHSHDEIKFFFFSLEEYILSWRESHWILQGSRSHSSCKCGLAPSTEARVCSAVWLDKSWKVPVTSHLCQKPITQNLHKQKS